MVEALKKSGLNDSFLSTNKTVCADNKTSNLFLCQPFIIAFVRCHYYSVLRV